MSEDENNYFKWVWKCENYGSKLSLMLIGAFIAILITLTINKLWWA